MLAFLVLVRVCRHKKDTFLSPVLKVVWAGGCRLCCPNMCLLGVRWKSQPEVPPLHWTVTASRPRPLSWVAP